MNEEGTDNFAASIRVDHGKAPTLGGGQTILGLLLSALSALILFTTFEGHGNLWPLVFVGFVPMYIAAYRLLPRRISAVAFAIAAFGYWMSLLLAGGGVLDPLLIVLGALAAAIVWLAIGVFERRFTERTNYKWFIIQLPLIWVGLEVTFQGNPVIGSNFWIAYRTASVPQFVQPVSIVSTPALGFLLIMVNAIIALIIMKWMDRRWPQLTTTSIPGQTVTRSAVITFGIAVVWIGVSLLINSQVNSMLGRSVKVAAVQTGLENTLSQGGTLGSVEPQGSPTDTARNANLQAQLTEMTTSAAEQGAELVVWPEETLNYDVRIPEKGAWIGEIARANNVTIVTGFWPEAPSFSSPNMAAVWYPDGQMDPRIYTKAHPVVVEGEAFTAGTAYPTYPTPFGNLGVIICFDHDFPNESARISTLAGADILAVPAIDPASIAHLRWQSVVFRAIENRVPIVKAEIAFDSVIVNANGVVQSREAVTDTAGEKALLIADVKIGPRNAPFTLWGGYGFGSLLVAALIARYLRQIQLARRSRRTLDATAAGPADANLVTDVVEDASNSEPL